MDRQYLAAVGLVAYGGGLALLYVLQGLWSGLSSVLRIGPFLLIAFALAYTGIWLVRNPAYRQHSPWVIAWTVGGGTSFMALATLVVLNHWVDVATTSPAALTILDTVTGGSLAGAVAGLYDAQSRKRLADLREERDTVERFAGKAESLNRYARALNESSHVAEISGLSIEVAQLLVGSKDAAFLVVAGEEVRVVDSTVVESYGLEAIGREVATHDPLETVLWTDESPDDLSAGGDVSPLIAIPVPASGDRTAVLLAVPEGPEAHTDQDVDLLELLGAHMATALGDVDSEPMESTPL